MTERRRNGRPLFDALSDGIASLGDCTVRVSRSQVAFSCRRAFAWARIPGRFLHREAAPLVLSMALDRRDASPRWKQVVEPAPGRLMHHLELHDPAALDEQVLGWLREARDQAEMASG